MTKYDIDLSNRRFNILWLLVGALIGRALGLILGLNLGMWYFADHTGVIAWQVFGVFTVSLFTSFMMTSDAPSQTKGAILGMGTMFAVAVYGGEVWMAMHHLSNGYAGLSVAEGIFFEWVWMHSSWLGLVIGWIIGARIAKRRSLVSAAETVS
jgi:hypothetical protein